MSPVIAALDGRPSPAKVNVCDFIDGQPVGRYQIGILLICAGVMFLDGYDTQAIGYVAPAIAREWHLSRGALGPVFSAGLLGLMAGALILGPMADRVGRRRIVVLSVVAFGTFSLTTLLSQNVYSLMAIRFMTGLGLGGAMPNTIALVSEFSPRRRRATMVMAMFCGFSVGAALGGLIAAMLIPWFGWRCIFLVGGIAPLLMALIITSRLPESIQFLALSAGNSEEIRDLLHRLFPSETRVGSADFVIQVEPLQKARLAQLFAKGRASFTSLLWIIFFMSLLDLYLLANWLPTILSDLGVSVSRAAVIGSMLQIGGAVGTLMLGSLIDRFAYRALAVTYLCAAGAIAAIGFTNDFSPLIMTAVFLSGFCIVGGQIAANALAATYYPITLRSTGVGWALGVGRAGSILGPLILGVMLSHHLGVKTTFVWAAAPALCACVAATALALKKSRHTTDQ